MKKIPLRRIVAANAFALLLLISCNTNDDSDTTPTEPEAQGCEDWQRNFGGSDAEFIYDIAASPDGGFVMAGASSSNISGDKTEDSRGSFDFWLVKNDASGAIQWEKTLGGNQNDVPFAVIATADGGYLIGGTSQSDASGEKSEANFGSDDIWVVKLNASGGMQWENTIGGDNLDLVQDMVQTSDGGYVLGATSGSAPSPDKEENTVGGFGDTDYWVIKLDPNGNIVWENTIGGKQSDFLQVMKPTSDGGFVLAGRSDSDISGDKTTANRGLIDYWVVKINAQGNVQWDTTLGGSVHEDAKDIIQTSDGGYLVTGYSDSNASGDKTEDAIGDREFWVVKLSTGGTLQWENTIGGLEFDDGTVVAESTDGTYLVGGNSLSNVSGDKTIQSFGDMDHWLVELDNSGIILDQAVWGGDRQDQILALIRTADGSFLQGGFSTSDVSGNKTVGTNGSLDLWLTSFSCLSDD